MSKITGHVKWFNESKGFGFITPADGSKDVSFIFPLSLAMVSRPRRKVSRLSSPSGQPTWPSRSQRRCYLTTEPPRNPPPAGFMPAARNVAHLCYHLPLIRRQPAGAPPFHSSYKSYRREHSFFFFPASASRTVGQPQRIGVRQNDTGAGRRVARHPARARRARQGETGSGKTAAFGIGLLNNIVVAQVATQALVLCPTRELADQVSKELRRAALHAERQNPDAVRRPTDGATARFAGARAAYRGGNAGPHSGTPAQENAAAGRTEGAGAG